MLSPFFYDLITEEEPPAERRNRECNFHRGTMPVSGIMRRGSDISRKAWARVKEGKVKEGGGKKKGTTENKFAGTGETTRARRESVEKRFLAV